MFAVGQNVTLDGRFQGGGIVVAVFPDAGAPDQVPHPFGRNRRTRKRPNQPFPQYGVVLADGRALHYNGADEQAGRIRAYWAARVQNAPQAGQCAMAPGGGGEANPVLQEILAQVRTLAQDVADLKNERDLD